MDVLTDVLGRARASGSLFAASRLHGTWGLAFAADAVPLSVHAVLTGEAWCRAGRAAPVRVPAGHVVLVRGGLPFALT